MGDGVNGGEWTWATLSFTEKTSLKSFSYGKTWIIQVNMRGKKVPRSASQASLVWMEPNMGAINLRYRGLNDKQRQKQQKSNNNSNSNSDGNGDGVGGVYFRDGLAEGAAYECCGC